MSKLDDMIRRGAGIWDLRRQAWREGRERELDARAYLSPNTRQVLCCDAVHIRLDRAGAWVDPVQGARLATVGEVYRVSGMNTHSFASGLSVHVVGAGGWAAIRRFDWRYDDGRRVLRALLEHIGCEREPAVAYVEGLASVGPWFVFPEMLGGPSPSEPSGGGWAQWV